jgi:hypothetical protein
LFADTQENTMTDWTTRAFLLAATVLDGLLAGMNLDRSVVHNSAWHELGAGAWAAYSLHADLSFRAALLYPFWAIVGALCSSTAAIDFYRNRNAPRAAAVPIYAGALLVVAGLLVTRMAAPNMISVPSLISDPAGLRSALAGFVFWGDIRGVLQVLAFFANLWSLVALLQSKAREDTSALSVKDAA